MKISFFVLYLFFYSLSGLAQEVPPVFSNFRIEANQKSRVYFDSSQPISGNSVVGIKISDRNIIGLNIVTGSTSGHYFSVSKTFSFWDNNTIRYEGGADLKGKNGISLVEFSLQYIKNNIPEPKGNGLVYYVSTNGSDSNSGDSESKAWRTISHGATKAQAGDIVYIKSGDYGNENINVKNNGTSTNPIKFIGYKTQPGDNPELARTQKTIFSSIEMPLIQSLSKNGNGFSFSGKKHIILKNIQVEGYNDGIVLRSDASYNLVENVYIKGAARMGINGFSRGAISNKFIRCYIANTSAVGIRISGERHLIDDFYVSSFGVNSMDYYISLYGGFVGTGTIVRNSSIIRDPRDSHTGHGISVKAEGYTLEHTLIENCKVQELGQAIELRHHLVKYTIVRNVTATGNRNSKSNLITFRDDTSYNTIENSTADGVYEAVRFMMNKGEDLGIQAGGHNNKIINSVFNNCKYNITISGLGGAPLESTNNEFLNCTFYNSNYMIALPINYNETNKFVNCIIDHVEKDVYGPGKLSAEFIYSNFYESYKIPKGIGNIAENPQFVNSNIGDFRLKSSSKLIDKGVKLIEVKYDFDGNSRPQGSSTDIGAFEYNDMSTTFIDANAGEDKSICKGETVTLVASGGDRYEWSTGETTKQIEVSPSESILYSVEVFMGNGSATDEVKVEVVTIVANAGKDVRITAGEEITLTASGGNSYKWSTGETTASIIVSPKVTEIYTVTVKEDNCEAQDEVKVIVNTTSVPAVVASAGEDRVICLGEEVTLKAKGGTKYTWSTGASNDEIKVSPTETTIYTVFVSDGITEDTDKVTVTVKNVEADAGNDVIINQGESIKLTATGGTNYLWSNGERTSSIIVQPSNTITYSVEVSNGSCSSGDEVKVTVLQPDIIPIKTSIDAGEDQTICLGQSITLTVNGSDNYTWSSGQTGEKIVVNPTRTEIFEVRSTINGETVSDSVTITVENCTSVSDNPIERDLNIQLYPNPTTGIVKIKSLSTSTETDIHLINMNGKILYQDTLESNQGGFGTQIDLSNFTKGVYFLRFLSEEEQFVKRIVLI